MHYDGDVIERLDRIEHLLAELVKRSSDAKPVLRASTGEGDRLLLRVSEASKQLSISRSQLYQLIAARKVPSVRIGRAVRVPYADLITWIKSQDRIRHTESS